MALKDFAKALQRTDELKITVVGRSSGRKITLSVWLVQDAKALFLLPVKGSGTEWYRNLLRSRTLGLAARGAKWRARKITLIRDRARIRKVVGMFRAKYGARDVKKFYSKFDAAVRIPLA